MIWKIELPIKKENQTQFIDSCWTLETNICVFNNKKAKKRERENRNNKKQKRRGKKHLFLKFLSHARCSLSRKLVRWRWCNHEDARGLRWEDKGSRRASNEKKREFIIDARLKWNTRVYKRRVYKESRASGIERGTLQSLYFGFEGESQKRTNEKFEPKAFFFFAEERRTMNC